MLSENIGSSPDCLRDSKSEINLNLLIDGHLVCQRVRGQLKIYSKANVCYDGIKFMQASYF